MGRRVVWWQRRTARMRCDRHDFRQTYAGEIRLSE
jgi:hypothetical protein